MTSNFLASLFASERQFAALLGVILVALGTAVSVKYMLKPNQPFLWWAMFILLPALMFFGGAWAAVHWNAPYRLTLGLFGLGLIVLAVAGMFLLNLNWERWWPVMLITPTLVVFLLGLPDEALLRHPEAAAWIGVLAWVGASAVLLGLTFLVGNFGLLDLRALTQRFGWWSIFIIICALGAAFNAWWLWGKTGNLSMFVTGLVLMSVLLLVTAWCEWFKLGWVVRLQSTLIASGLLLILSYILSNRLSVAP